MFMKLSKLVLLCIGPSYLVIVMGLITNLSPIPKLKNQDLEHTWGGLHFAATITTVNALPKQVFVLDYLLLRVIGPILGRCGQVYFGEKTIKRRHVGHLTERYSY